MIERMVLTMLCTNIVTSVLLSTGVYANSFVAEPAIGARFDDSDKFRIATAYERTGDFRNAARLYQELHAADPRNDSYFSGVVRSLSGLGQYAALLPLAEKKAIATKSPDDAILVGTLYARQNKLDNARSWWEKARSLSDDDESTIVRIGRDQMELFLHADALESFLAARTRNGSANAYADEVFKLRSASGDVSGAVADVIAAFSNDGDELAAERRLSMLLSFDGGQTIIAESLAELPRTVVKNLRLSAWFFRETKRWKDAFDVISQLDQRSAVPGSELLMFAEGARSSEQYDVALQAYDEVARRSKEANMVMSAAFGSVRSLELRMRGATTITPTEARDVIRRYDDIISRYGNNPLVADALYFSGLLYDDVLREIDPARDRLLRLMNTWKASPRSVDAALRLADMYLAMGQDNRAREVLNGVITAPKGLAGDRADMAQIRLADILLWNGQLDSAKALYSPLAEASGSIASNDAIDRMLLLNLALDDSGSVKAIARAEGMVVRRRHAEAIKELEAVISSIRDLDLRDRSLLLCAKSCLEVGDSARAGEHLKKIIEMNPDSIFGDRAIWMYADLVAKRNEPLRAAQILETLLRNYPRSIIVPDAREQIRRLRGDSK
ncbi:MAG: tetratricopeptide repeat protein [Candidatus Kapabacteria bacterium]|nr:tetratricopeptide repeat protein [Candidatus Kapabacteria bacterium]